MVTLLEIVFETGFQAGVSREDLVSLQRLPPCQAARRRAAWACRELRPDASLTQIGRRLRRDHSSIQRMIEACRAERLRDPDERAAGDAVLAALRLRFPSPPPPSLVDQLQAVAAAAFDGENAAQAAARIQADPARARQLLSILITQFQCVAQEWDR